MIMASAQACYSSVHAVLQALSRKAFLRMHHAGRIWLPFFPELLF